MMTDIIVVHGRGIAVKNGQPVADISIRERPIIVIN
jgi:hypothetical protein